MRILLERVHHGEAKPAGWVCGRAVGCYGIADGPQHECDEPGGGSVCVGCVQGGVITALTLPNHALHGKPCQYGSPSGEKQGVPEPARSAVSVGEGVHELEFVVEHAGSDQRRHFGTLQPREHIGHDSGDVGGRRARVDEDAPLVVHARVLRAEPARVFRKSLHHRSVGSKEVVEAERVQLVHEVVGSFGVFDLPDVVGRAENPLSLENGGHLLLGERVLLDGKRGVDRLYAQPTMQGGRGGEVGSGGEAPHHLGDFECDG